MNKNNVFRAAAIVIGAITLVAICYSIYLFFQGLGAQTFMIIDSSIIQAPIKIEMQRDSLTLTNVSNTTLSDYEILCWSDSGVLFEAKRDMPSIPPGASHRMSLSAFNLKDVIDSQTIDRSRSDWSSVVINRIEFRTLILGDDTSYCTFLRDSTGFVCKVSEGFKTIVPLDSGEFKITIGTKRKQVSK